MFNQRDKVVLAIREKDSQIVLQPCSIEQFQLLPSESIYHVVAFSHLLRPVKWGIPPEIVTVLNPSIDFIKIERSKVQNDIPEICFVYSDEMLDPEYKVARKILFAFNNLLQYKLTMILPVEVISSLKKAANENIQFIPYDNLYHQHISNCDLLLAEGERAINALLNKIPVIITGRNGIGGLVTDDNLKSMIRTEFRGRIGGTLFEDIPALLLYDEIVEFISTIHSEPDNHQTLSEESMAHLRLTYIDNGNTEKTDQLVEEAKLLSTLLRDDRLIEDLKPKITSNIELLNSDNNSVRLRNMITGMAINIAGETEFKIGLCFNGISKVRDIIFSNEFSRKEVIQMVRENWNKKNVVFVH